MKKHFKLGYVFAALCLVFVPLFSIRSAQPAENPASAIVKIQSYALDTNNKLQPVVTGSGVIIDENGLILTTSDVTEVQNTYDGSRSDTAYNICLTVNENASADCSYTAHKISNEEGGAFVLLRIDQSTESSPIVFPYLTIKSTDTSKLNDSVTLFEYKNDLRNFLTKTTGVISAKSSEEGVILFSNTDNYTAQDAGGVLVDSERNAIGLTLMEYSEALDVSPFILTISPDYSWIEESKDNEIVSSELDAQLDEFLARSKALGSTNIFESNAPHFKITKPDEYSYYLPSEEMFIAGNPSNDQSGGLAIVTVKEPFITSVDDVISQLKRLAVKKGSLGLLQINGHETTMLNGHEVEKVHYTDNGGEAKIYVIPAENYLLFVFYDYGANDQDKLLVDSMIQSIDIPYSDIHFDEQQRYSQADPYFAFQLKDDWVAMAQNDPAAPLQIFNKKYRDVFIQVTTEKTGEEPYTQEDLAVILEGASQLINNPEFGCLFNTRDEFRDIVKHYDVSDNFKDTLKSLAIFKERIDNEVMMYEYGFSKQLDSGYLIHVSMITTNPSPEYLIAYQNEFHRVLEGFTLNQLDSDNDGLLDDDEVKYGTDIHSSDSDNDGYADKLEIDNGYSPLGPGKLEKK